MPTLGTETILMIAVVAALLAVLLVIKLIAFFNEYNKETQYIRIEMNETQDLSEQRYWQQKQSYHRLCLIPFVTENNVEKVYSALHGGRHARATQKSIMRMLVPMILGLSVCLVSLSGLTYAWFTATLQGTTQTIRTAAFRVEVTVKQGENSEPVAADDKGNYAIKAGKAYTFTMKAAADNTASRGYCKLLLKKAGESAGTPYYTATFEKNDTYTLTMTPESDMTVTVEPLWGKIEKQTPSVSVVENNKTIGSAPKTTTTTSAAAAQRVTSTTRKPSAVTTTTTVPKSSTTTPTTTGTTHMTAATTEEP